MDRNTFPGLVPTLWGFFDSTDFWRDIGSVKVGIIPVLSSWFAEGSQAVCLGVQVTFQ